MKHILLFSSTFFFVANFAFSQGTAINATGAPADNSALLDLSSTGKGFLLPRMTNAERNAIPSPAQSLVIFNTTTTCFEYYYSGIWYSMSCICTVPQPPLANAASDITSSSFSANWTASTGATSYYLDVSTDVNFTAFVTGYNNLNAGSATTYSITGLVCGTTYYYRIRAGNNCGISSNTNIITITTSACFSCGSILAITHTAGAVAPVSKAVNYGTVSTTLGGTGVKCWITQNLGADNQAASATDATEPSAGWYWQFNRKQGYKHDGSTLTPSPFAGYFPDTLDWMPGDDPCTIELGAGWRVPTYNEWNNADITGGWANYADTYNSVLRLHAAGYLQSGSGALSSRGVDGFYWSSTRVIPGNINSNMWNINMDSGSSYMNQSPYVYGFSVRCLKD